MGKRHKKQGKLKRYQAGAVKPTKKELDLVIDQKIQEKINRQKELMKIFLQRVLREAELTEMGAQIKSKEVKIEWHGMPMPMEILKAQYNMLLHSYKEIVSSEQYFRQALMNDGLTEDEIKGILVNSKYITDRKFLMNAEKKATEERLKKEIELDKEAAKKRKEKK